MNDAFACPDVEISEVAPLLPIFQALHVTEFKDDHIGVLTWKWVGHPPVRAQDLDLGYGDFGLRQGASNRKRRILGAIVGSELVTIWPPQ